ncbi:hypothetical protein ACGFZH_24500 [Streptomyces zaomyceticus]
MRQPELLVKESGSRLHEPGSACHADLRDGPAAAAPAAQQESALVVQ